MCPDRPRLILILALSSLALLPTARAAVGPTNAALGKGPIHISADSLTAQNKPQQQAVYTGKVVMTQGDIVIHAQKLTIDARQGKVEVATAVGSPVTFTMSSAQRHGYGDTLVYRPGSGEIVLTGNAHLWQGPNEVSGQQVVYHLQDQHTTVSAAPGQRVQSVFYPGTAKTAASPGGKP
ncbi:MAG: lipopolysaccharide transport periplasmic protein LptA [Acidithiobacillus sp.]|uniref:lipopolysaccharide transport periplasmic protein LptA n=1 Tax=Acidithiobacillus sp. TaxID=1872118 RepID=UPI003D0902B3